MNMKSLLAPRTPNLTTPKRPQFAIGSDEIDNESLSSKEDQSDNAPTTT